jgi:broad-specificity NMP kinase
MRALIWVSALVNAALVYLFSPTSPSMLESEKKVILLWIVLVLLAASHGFMIVQVAVRYFIERIFWRGSDEEKRSENVEKEVKNVCLKTLNHDALKSGISAIIEENGEVDDFWKLDEGLQEMRNGLKES